jgi:hypothetical protein
MTSNAHIDVSATVALRLLARTRLRQLAGPRWIVYQTKAIAAYDELIYANVFWRKATALRAQNARNADIRTVGKMAIGPTRLAHVVRLPLERV